MRKILIVTIFIYLISSSLPSFTEETNGDETLVIEDASPEIVLAITQFSLAISSQHPFSLKSPSNIVGKVEISKDYLRAGQEVVAINVIVWGYDRFVLRANWAKISLRTIIKNFKCPYEWDDNSFKVNQFEHPYHGALYFSSSRFHGLNYWESSIYSFIGSFMWEFLLETNCPSANDIIMTPLGGMTFGEILFRIAGLIYDESSRSIPIVFQRLLILVINPVYGFNLFTGRTPKGNRNPLASHDYDFNIPFGVYGSFTDKPSFLIGVHLEYKDVFHKSTPTINPYDWFSSNIKLGFHQGSFHDKEIVTTGLLTGKRTNPGLTGLFAVFDYIDTRTSEKRSAVGMGPGIITYNFLTSKLYFKSVGVISATFGGSSSSLDPVYRQSETGKIYPYEIGPGLLARIELEIGKKDLTSIQSRFTQYWLHSIHSRADEFASTLSSNLNVDLTRRSRISLEYDYYSRNEIHQKRVFSHRRNAIFILYILKF